MFKHQTPSESVIVTGDNKCNDILNVSEGHLQHCNVNVSQESTATKSIYLNSVLMYYYKVLVVYYLHLLLH